MKNKLLPLFFLVAFLPVSLIAQSVSIWDGTSEIWTQGSGTKANPYLIQNAQQLAYIAEMVNGGLTHYENTYFKLTTNIEIDSTTAWQPIGLNETYYFSGHFDADNHLITLYLHTSTLQYVGLFGYIMNASINNLGVDGIEKVTNVDATFTGGIAAAINKTTILNCYYNGEILDTTLSSLYSYIGGIVGYMSDTSVIENSYNTGLIITTSGYAAGIAGVSNWNYDSYASILNCYNTGDIYSIRGTAGGIVGMTGRGGNGSFGKIVVTNCYNTGNVSINTGTVGGIIGRIYYTRAFLNKCYNNSNITSSSDAGSIAGGIVGELSNISSSQSVITNTYNVGNVSAISSLNGASPTSGGIVGSMGNGDNYVSNSYNTGNLTGNNKGGIIGKIYFSPIITNCHYLNTCGHNTSTGGAAKTEAQMKSPSFPVILNTDSVVFVKDITPNINQGYPVFGSVRTLDADSIGNTAATLHGDYQMLYDVDVHGFEYKKNSESEYTTVITSGYSPVSKPISGLQGGTEYSYRFFVQKDGVTYRGLNKTFNTVECTLTAQISTSSNTLCEGDTVIYTATATSSNPTAYQYIWSTGDSLNTIPVTNGANYTVTVTDAYGCSTTQSKQMTVYPAAVASITGSTVLCNNGSTTLTANGGTYYSWNTGSAQRTITVTQPGTYIATVQTVYGCSASDTVEVTAFANPTINGNLTFCSGDYTTLTASGGDTYLWGNGATTPSINVNTEGTYSVTASTSNGCSGSTSVTVIQNQASDVSISGNTVICSDIGTSLTISSGTDYLWSTGETTQSINVNNPGTYSVTVTNSNGCNSSATQTVSMMEQPIISGNNHICSGQSATLTTSGSGSYAWSNGASSSSITVNTPGTYSVTITLSNGCSSSATVNVYVGTTPTPSIAGSTTLCEGQASTLTANGGVSYAWSNGSTNNSINVAQSGVYTVTATNVEGCSATAQVSVTVNALPEVNISGNTTLCAGSSTTLTASGADTYQWSDGSTNASLIVNAFGIYTVTGTSSAGCTNTANVTVLVSQAPQITITGDTEICSGESTTLTANGGDTYLWSNGNTEPTLTVNTAGTWQVIGYNEAGCNAMASATVNVWQPTSSEFTITTNNPCYTWNDVEYCESGDYTQTLETVHGCDSVVTLHLTIGVGIADHDRFNIKVYPNPTSNIVNVEFGMGDGELGDVKIQLYDVFGKLLNVMNVVGANNHSPLQTEQIDLSRYANGVYFIKLVSDRDGRILGTQKIVKQ